MIITLICVFFRISVTAFTFLLSVISAAHKGKPSAVSAAVYLTLVTVLQD